jgi:hypothetical protein
MNLFYHNWRKAVTLQWMTANASIWQNFEKSVTTHVLKNVGKLGGMRDDGLTYL